MLGVVIVVSTLNYPGLSYSFIGLYADIAMTVAVRSAINSEILCICHSVYDASFPCSGWPLTIDLLFVCFSLTVSFFILFLFYMMGYGSGMQTHVHFMEGDLVCFRAQGVVSEGMCPPLQNLENSTFLELQSRNLANNFRHKFTAAKE